MGVQITCDGYGTGEKAVRWMQVLRNARMEVYGWQQREAVFPDSMRVKGADYFFKEWRRGISFPMESVFKRRNRKVQVRRKEGERLSHL